MAHDIGIGSNNEISEFESLFRGLRSVSKKIETLKDNKFNEEKKSRFDLEGFVNSNTYEIEECLRSCNRFIDDETKKIINLKFSELEKNLNDYYEQLNESLINLDFGGRDAFQVILNDIKSIIRGELGGKFTEYSGYLKKIEPLIKIENNFLRLEELFVGVVGSEDDDVEINRTLDNIRLINGYFKSREKYKFFIILPLEYLNHFSSKTDTFFALFTDKASKDSVDLIDTFRDLVESLSFVGNRKFWSNDDFWEATYKYGQYKEINGLSNSLVKKIKIIDDFKELEDKVINGYESSFSESFSLMDKVKSDIRGELSLAKNYVKQLEKEKNAVLQYSEDVKNTDAVKVYSDLYKTEILAAAWFRLATLFIFGVLSFIALICLIALFLFPENNFIVKNLINTDKILGKIPFIITFFVFGFYLAKEGEKHRRIANQAKQTEGELIALASYTNGWDSQEIRELKTKLADKYFGKNLYETEKSLPHDGDMVKSLIEQTKVTTDLVKTLKGSIPSSSTSQDTGKGQSGTRSETP